MFFSILIIIYDFSLEKKCPTSFVLNIRFTKIPDMLSNNIKLFVQLIWFYVHSSGLYSRFLEVIFVGTLNLLFVFLEAYFNHEQVRNVLYMKETFLKAIFVDAPSIITKKTFVIKESFNFF